LITNTLMDWMLYGVVFVGLWGLVRRILEPALKQQGQLWERRVRSGWSRRAWVQKLHQHLDPLLYLTRPDYEPVVSVDRFLLKSGFIFVGVFVTLFGLLGELPLHLHASNPFLAGVRLEQSRVSWGFAFWVSVLISLFPYVRLRIAFQRKQVKAGYDLLEAVKVLARFTHLSVDVALGCTSDALVLNNVLVRPLKMLALAFSSYGSDRELRDEVERFVAATGTTFAVTFVSNLIYQHKEGGGALRVSLLGLSEAMEEQRIAVWESRKGVHDAIALGSYGNLLVFLVTSGSMGYLLTLPIYLKLQFQTATGLGFITAILIGMIASFVVSSFLSRPKLDYK
jgi:hypothetical protein